MLASIVNIDPSATPASGPFPSEAAVDLDLRGLKCPLPVLRTRKALGGLRPGAVLRVLCTDPLAGLDIPHLVASTGDTLLAVERAEAAQAFTIRKS